MIKWLGKKIYSYSDELKCLEFGCKLYKIYRMFLIHSCFFNLSFYLAVSINPCKLTLACLFRAKCRGDMKKKRWTMYGEQMQYRLDQTDHVLETAGNVSGKIFLGHTFTIAHFLHPYRVQNMCIILLKWFECVSQKPNWFL